MGSTTRFGVSMDSDLVELLDRFADVEGHANRSEALRSLVRGELTRGLAVEDRNDVIGIVTLIYRTGKRLPNVPVADYPTLRISANLQLHVERESCIKLIVVQGSAGDVRAWSSRLTGRPGVIGRLTICATDELLQELKP